MQGLFVGDQETPTECLKRELELRLHAPVEVLEYQAISAIHPSSTLHAGRFARKFPTQFVVVSVFANDFGGDVEAVLLGNGDMEEARYWLGASASIASSEMPIFSSFPHRRVKQIEEPQLAGHYPGRFSNVLEATGSNPRPDRRLRRCEPRRFAVVEESGVVPDRQHAVQRAHR